MSERTENMLKGFVCGLVVAVMAICIGMMIEEKQGPAQWEIEKVRVLKMLDELEAENQAEMEEVQREQEIIDSQLEQYERYEQKKSVDSQRQMI